MRPRRHDCGIQSSAILFASKSSRCSGTLFNSSAATDGKSDYRSASGVIDHERKKKLAVDIDLFLYQRSFDRKLAHFHRQHPFSVRAHILWFFGEGDSADPCASCGPCLNLNDNFAAKFLRCQRDGIRRRRRAARNLW